MTVDERPNSEPEGGTGTEVRSDGQVDPSPHHEEDSGSGELEHEEFDDELDAPGSPEFRKRDQIIREERRVGAQTLTGPARAAMGTQGPTTLGDYSPVIEALYLSVTERQWVPLEGPVSHEQLGAWRNNFVETRAYGYLVDCLPSSHVQILQGRDGSGRTTTALLALDHVVYPSGPPVDGPDIESNIKRLDCEKLSEIIKDVLQEGHGYLLDRSSADAERELNPVSMGQLKQRARDCDAFIVVIVSHHMPLDRHDLGEYLVIQDPPDPIKVLEAHLEGRVEALYNNELREEVEREAKSARAVRQVVDLAQYLESAASQGISDDTILSGLVQRLVVRARVKFANPFGNDDPGAPRSRAERLCRQAQLIACAVLDQMPLVTVMDAAMSLATRLHHVQTGREALPCPVFSGTVDDFLEYVDHLEDQAPGANGATRRIRIHPRPAAVVLEVAWRDYDTVRKPLLAWLQELAVAPEEALRVRAAIAVGKLASYDCDYIFGNIVDEWARSQRSAHRWAAAWALEQARCDPALKARVDERVESWRRGSYSLQRTVLHAFTTTIGLQNVGDTLRSLDMLALQRGHARDYALARALREIFLDGYHEEARELLDKWANIDVRNTHERPRAVQAARGLLMLSEGIDEASGTPSVLVSLFADDARWRGTATRVWRLALENPITSEAAWNVLRLWLRQGGEKPRLVEPLTDLVADLARDPGFRNRARFRQRFWNARKATKDQVVDDILTRGLSGNTGSPS